MEQLQQQIVEHHLLAAAQKVEDQLDNEMHQLQKLEEDDMESLRQQRLQQMKKAALKKKEWLSKGHGEYNEIATEKEFFAEMKGEERMICHFYRENWPCKVHRSKSSWPALLAWASLLKLVDENAGHGQAHADSGQAACRNKVYQG